MDLLEAIYSYLVKNESVKSKVGDKIYPILLPQDCTLPAIVYAPVVANYSSRRYRICKTDSSDNLSC